MAALWEDAMDLRKLKSFVAVSELTSFTAASKSVNLTQSAVSQQIKDLEEELGCKLINRGARPISITKEGAELIVVARQILNIWQDFKAKKNKHEFTGSILLGYVRSAITDALARSLYSIRQMHPMVTIQLIYTEGITKLLAEEVAEGRLDAALGVAPIDLPKGMVWRPYSAEKYFVVAPINYQGETDEALLTQGPYIRFKPHLLAETVMDKEIRRRGIEVKKVMELDDYESILVMVGNHLGVGIVQEHYLSKDRLSNLKWVPFGLPPLRREGGIIAKVDSPKNQLIDLLWESLRSVQ
jgi:DNA-binding transcriptional LysR family regulator